MHQSKIFQYLAQLSKKEKKEFYDFALSPYSNLNEGGRKLIQLIRQAPNLSSPVLKAENVIEVLGLDRKKRDPLGTHKSNLKAAMELFFSFNSLKNDKVQQAVLLNQNLLDRRFENVLKNKFDNSIIALNEQLEGESKMLRSLQLNLIEHHRIEAKADKLKDPNLESVYPDLDRFFVLHKLKYACKGLQIQTRYNTNQSYQYFLLEEVLTALKMGKFKDDLLIQMYFNAYQCLFSHEEAFALKSYEALSESVYENHTEIEKKEAICLLNFACNYCIQNLNKGDKRYLEEYKKNFEFQVKHDYIQLDIAAFRNAVQVYIALDKADAAEQFLDNYQNSISKGTLLLCKATLLFAQNEHQKVLDLINESQLKQDDLIIKLKFIELKARFELWQSQKLTTRHISDTIEALRSYLNRRSKNNSSTIRPHFHYYKNAIKYTKTLFNILKNQNNSKLLEDKLKELRNNIKKSEDVYYKPWIYDKIDDTLKKMK